MIDNLGGRLGTFDRLERQLPAGESWSGFDRALSGSAYFGRAPAAAADTAARRPLARLRRAVELARVGADRASELQLLVARRSSRSIAGAFTSRLGASIRPSVSAPARRRASTAAVRRCCDAAATTVEGRRVEGVDEGAQASWAEQARAGDARALVAGASSSGDLAALAARRRSRCTRSRPELRWRVERVSDRRDRMLDSVADRLRSGAEPAVTMIGALARRQRSRTAPWRRASRMRSSRDRAGQRRRPRARARDEPIHRAGVQRVAAGAGVEPVVRAARRRCRTRVDTIAAQLGTAGQQAPRVRSHLGTRRGS